MKKLVGVVEDKATKLIRLWTRVTTCVTPRQLAISEDDVTGLTWLLSQSELSAGSHKNPTSTAIFTDFLKTRNPIVFAFHPSVQESSAHATRIVRDATAGAPENCVQWITQPCGSNQCPYEPRRSCDHPRPVVTLMVKAAYSVETSLGWWRNVPACAEKSANIRQAAHDIVRF